MVIDIISYTEAQYAALNEELLLEVKSAQLKKNTLDRKLQEDLETEKHRLVKNGIFDSKIWKIYKDKRQAAHDAEVETLRESLLFFLQYAAKAEQESSTPYTVDYSLTMQERYNVVKDYYMSAYDQPNARLNAFLKDSVATAYLGEWYSTLYNYLKGLV
ncbi:MAG: hypothetical protein IJA89_02605 [Clostridia bacterium]|nr:hypothetical protein [Clostridiales bacterium]MBQ3505644.1 hypothetical protein [Clostridia bacterium]